MNFYKRHIGDYLRDAGHLSLLEHGVYTRLLDVYYTREGPIPAEQAARLVGARTREEREAVDRVLAEFFEPVGEAWVQRRCEREIEAATTKAERNREVGKLGGRPRKPETQTVPEQKPTENPNGFQTEPKQNPSQTPDSRLQTPEEENNPHLPATVVACATVGDSVAGRDRPPENPEPTAEPPPDTTRYGVLSAELRRRGVRCTGSHPDLVALVDDGFALPEIVEALAVAAMADSAPKPMNVGYLARVVRSERERAKRPARNREPAWWTSEAATEAKAREVGCWPARPAESWDQLRNRIRERLAQREQEAAA